MDELYKRACGAYLEQYINKEPSENGLYQGWYNYIDSPQFNTVGVVLTSQVLIMIKDCDIPVEFDCAPMVESLLNMQNADGGWSYRTNIRTSAAEPTALAVQAILRWCSPIEGRPRFAVESGIAWLLKHRNSGCLWGPLKVKAKAGYTYFSCSVLRCLHWIRQSNEMTGIGNLEQIVESGCDALLKAFKDSDIQCGWGETVDSEPTIFHTAYVIDTLLSLDPAFMGKHQIIKSCAFLREKYADIMANLEDTLSFRMGGAEIYQYKANRLSYTHSVDVYVLSALLRNFSKQILPLIGGKMDSFIHCAERTDWRYHGAVTGWRMYDIVSLCNLYGKIQGDPKEKIMNHYKIALTFPGEYRTLVEDVANRLSVQYGKEQILYDKFHEEEFARSQLDLYLQDLYRNHSDLIVVFLCNEYAQKHWCGVEWRAIRDILNNMNYEKIMYIKVSPESIDNVSFPGFYASEDGYIDAEEHSPEELADLIVKRFNRIAR